MSNSSLVNYTKLSPNHSGARNHTIDTITIHCVVGQCSVQTLGSIFSNSAYEASANYGVGYDGKIGLYVDEANRSWCSSSSANDNRAVTIEVASDTTSPYAVKDAAYNATIELVADICRRNGIKSLKWSTSKNDRVNHLNGCNMTVHRDYANKSCPGDYLYNRMGDIAAKVNAKLGASSSSNSTTTTSSTSTTTTTPTSSSSSGSSSIKAVQAWVGTTQDGIYGTQTKTALVKKLQTELNTQCNAGLTVDGIWGTNTRNAVANWGTLSQGMSGNLTKTLQGLLICNGYSTNGFDGVFGSGTTSAVKSYQSNHGLTADGIAGANTFAKLCG